jgi:hypothetical protein
MSRIVMVILFRSVWNDSAVGLQVAICTKLPAAVFCLLCDDHTLWFLFLQFRKGRRNHIGRFICCPSSDSTTSLGVQKCDDFIEIRFCISLLNTSPFWYSLTFYWSAESTWLFYEMRWEQHLFHWAQDQIFCIMTTLLKLFQFHYGMFKRRKITCEDCSWRIAVCVRILSETTIAYCRTNRQTVTWWM